MLSSLVPAALVALAIVPSAVASSCIVFDAGFNLLAFGFGSKDYSAGTQDTWGTSGGAKDITASGRPPFNGAGTTCYLSQFTNAIYVMNGDASAPSSVHIYDATAKSWTTQKVTDGKFNPASFDAILDHDTNVFYALSNNELYFLDMTAQKAAQSDALSWTDAKPAPFTSYGSPVMALAQNHIHFLDVPGVDAGSADIFVIHFSYFQPEAQAFPNVNGGASFPAAHGQAATFFLTDAVGEEFSFIPDDGSATYVINVSSNTTTTLAGPSTKDAKASYYASVTALVQLASSGAVSYLPYTAGDATTNAAAQWAPVKSLAGLAGAGGSGGSSGANGTASGTKSGAPSATATHASAANRVRVASVLGSLVFAAIVAVAI